MELMKHLRSLICVLLLLCLCVGGAALAENRSILQLDEKGGAYAREMFVADDTVYITVRDGMNVSIYRWKAGMDKAELAAEKLLYAGNFELLEDMKGYVESAKTEVVDEETGKPPEWDMDHAVSTIATDGEKLYGFNHLTGLVFEMKLEAGKVVYTDVVTVKSTADYFHNEGDEGRWTNAPTSAIVAGGKLLMRFNDWQNNPYKAIWKLVSYDLKDGSVKEACVKDAAIVTGYKDGKVLVFAQEGTEAYDDKGNKLPMQVYAYDPAADQATKLGDYLMPNSDYTRMAYDPATDTLLYQDSTVLKGTTDWKNVDRYAYIPGDSAMKLAVMGDSIVHLTNYEAYTRTLQKGYTTTHSVRFLNGFVQQDWVETYAKANLDVPVYRMELSEYTADSISRAMSAGKEAADLVRIGVTDQPFQTLMDKGYCLDLSSSKIISDYVNSLYKPYRDVVMKDGKIMAVPMSGVDDWNGVFINKKVMEDMGLKVEDIPTNLVDLCAFATRWSHEWTDYQNYSLLEYTKNYKSAIFDWMMQMWVDYNQYKGTELRFDDPIFREMMAALEQMDVRELDASTKKTNPEVSDYKQGLLWNDVALLNNWADYMSPDSDRVFIPMTMTKDTEFFVPVKSMYVLYVNPKSENKEQAIALAEEMVKSIIPTGEKEQYWLWQRAYALISTLTEPMEDPYFEERMENAKERLESLKKSLMAADAADKKDYEDQIAQTEERIKRLERERYSISPSAIKQHQEVLMPVTFVRRPSILTAGTTGNDVMQTLIKRYKDGQIKIDQFIREADSKLQMMQMEDY